MKGFKKYYSDENDLIEDYCKSVNCNICHGSDLNGEPNGYGCRGLDDFLEENTDELVLTDDDLIEAQKEHIEELQAIIKVLEPCIEFCQKGHLNSDKMIACDHALNKIKEIRSSST